MNATQPLQPPQGDAPARQRRPRLRHHSKAHPPYQELVWETTIKLGINLTFSLVAIATLAKILPYQLSQEEKLQEIRAEVAATQGRVDRLRSEFSRNFDPQQTRSVMQEQSSRVDPLQRPVVWLPSPSSPAPTSENSGNSTP